MRIEHSGNATISTLSASITDSDVTISCVDLTNWSDGSIGDFYGSINKGTGTEEKIRFSGRTGNVLAVAERGVDGTTAQSHAINSSIEHVWTAVEADEANAHQEATTGTVHGLALADVALTSEVTVAIADAVEVETDARVAADALKANLSVTVNAKTGDFTLTNAENGEVVTMDKATANTLTIGTGRPAGFTAVIVQLGAGQTTIAASGTTLRATPGLKLRAQYSAATVIHLGSEVYLVTGDLSA